MEKTHRFKVGQTVMLAYRRYQSAASGDYRIVRLLPIEGGQLQYRIKSTRENHERVVPEDQLTLPN